ncbi:thioredoxin domain-containing protein [Vibrio sp. ER1A]|uniref:thioredoxin domain-containing protein n=1 Tax=Vibrio sp. ER1A TaxID=1517681 RepID=UPI00068A8003|nr:thioredoxin domain-containing protein [Vibrio sp. ER1A]
MMEFSINKGSKRAVFLVAIGLVFLNSAFAKTNNDSAENTFPLLNSLPSTSKAVIKTIISDSNQLALDPYSPAIGSKDAPVTVIEFLDYQCMYCHKAFPEFEKFINSHKNVRVVFKQLPIMGEVSRYAALTALEAYRQGGSSLFLRYHNAQFTALNDDGKEYTAMLRTHKLTKRKVDEIAGLSGVVIKPEGNLNNAHRDILNNDLSLAKEISVKGTPTFIVLPTPSNKKKINEDSISFMQGAVTKNYLDEAVIKAEIR